MIDNLKEEDIDDVLLISDLCVGEHFQTYDSIKDYLSDDKKILKVYKIDDEIIGFAKGEVIEKSTFKKHLLKSNLSIDNKLAGEDNMGLAETICVKEEFRGRKIARELADDLIQSLKNIENIDSIYTTVWKTSEGANAKRLIENIGFEYITEIADYWYDDSIEKNYKCPKCGNPPCKCSTVFYKL